MSKLGRDLGQFRDPWGLVRRMVSSGDQAARWALMHTAASRLATPVDALLGLGEKRRAPAPSRSDLPLILIIGPPRAGTTLLYQVLARCLDVSYFDNLSALFPRAPLTGRLLFGRPGRETGYGFRSYYGNTAGWYAPNDGFHVWNRWLGDHRYHAHESLSEGSDDDMRRFFAAWLEETGKPFLNKNNRNADCVPLLAETLRNAFFIEVDREPEYVVQSLLLARAAIQGRAEYGWGLDSEQVELGAGREAVVNSVCDQVIRIREKLVRAAAAAGDSRYLRVSYEDLCRDPAAMVETVAAFIPRVELRPNTDLGAMGTFSARNERRLPQSEIENIRQRLREPT